MGEGVTTHDDRRRSLPALEPLYCRQLHWPRLLIRPATLRAIHQCLSTSIGTPRSGERRLEGGGWIDRNVAVSDDGSGPDSVSMVERQIAEMAARHGSMKALWITLGRAPEKMPVPEILRSPRMSPKPRATCKNGSDRNAGPVYVKLTLERVVPCCTLEVLSFQQDDGRAVVSFLKPHLDAVARRGPAPRTATLASLVAAGAVLGMLFAVGAVPLSLTLALTVGCGTLCAWGVPKLVRWLFPALELLPTDYSRTRWQRAASLLGKSTGIAAGLVSIAAFVLRAVGG